MWSVEAPSIAVSQAPHNHASDSCFPVLGLWVEDPGIPGLTQPNTEPHHWIRTVGWIPALRLLCDWRKVSGSWATISFRISRICDIIRITPPNLCSSKKSSWSMSKFTVCVWFFVCFFSGHILTNNSASCWKGPLMLFKVGDYVLFGTYIIQLYTPLNWFGTYYR